MGIYRDRLGGRHFRQTRRVDALIPSPMEPPCWVISQLPLCCPTLDPVGPTEYRHNAFTKHTKTKDIFGFPNLCPSN